MTTIDLYDVLLVEPDCTINDIKEAYKKLAQKYHHLRQYVCHLLVLINLYI